MENSNGGKWKVSSCDMAGVVGENRILSDFEMFHESHCSAQCG